MTDHLPVEALPSLEEIASSVVLPDDPATLHELALRVIASPRCVSYKEPGYAAVAIATFALGRWARQRNYQEGEVLLKVSLAQGALE